jgi:hypothetical protein
MNIMVHTCNEPTLLTRSLNNLLESGAKTIHICDDSRDGTISLLNQQIVDMYQGLYKVPVRYVGRVERASIVADLQKATADISCEDLSFGLLGGSRDMISTGSSRNASLILCAGSPYISLDDDVLPNPLKYEAGASQNANPPLIAQFVGSLDHSNCVLKASDKNIVEIASRQFRAVSSSLCSAEAGRTLITQFGLTGHSPFSSPSWVLLASGPWRTTLLSDDEAYRKSLQSQYFKLNRGNTILSSSSMLVSYAVSIDGRMLLPPFFPVGRNSDGLFGWMARQMYPGMVTAFVPEMVTHLKALPPNISRDAVWKDAVRVRTTDLVLILLRREAKLIAQEETPTKRLSMMGEILMRNADLISMGEGGFWQDALSPLFRSRLTSLSELVKNKRISPSALLDIDCACALLQEQLKSLSANECFEDSVDDAHNFSYLLRSYARLVEMWPSVWEHAFMLKRDWRSDV